MKNKKSQSSVEYLIIIGFVTFAVMSILLIAYFYSGIAKNKIRENQMEIFASKIVNSAESVFYSGEPSKASFSVYIPEGVQSIAVMDDYDLVVTMSTSSGNIKRAFSSKVKLEIKNEIINPLMPSSGVKNIVVEAKSDKVWINP